MTASSPLDKPIAITDLVEYQRGSVVSQALVKGRAGTVTVFAFDEGEGLSEHTAPFDALLHVVDGQARVRVGEDDHTLNAGDVILLPANVPHAVQAVKRFKMILVMIRESAQSSQTVNDRRPSWNWGTYEQAHTHRRKEARTMRKLVAGAFVTLDGVVQAPGGPDEDRDGGFRHGGWLVPFFDEKFGEIMTDWTKRAGAFLLGRKTYEIFAASWPKSTDPADEIATALNNRPKFVASRTLDQVEWSNSTLLAGDVAEAVAGLKTEEGGELQVHGSGDLLQTLLKHDLVDTLRIWVFPVVLGTGKRLFGEGANPAQFSARGHTAEHDRWGTARLRARRRTHVRRSRGR